MKTIKDIFYLTLLGVFCFSVISCSHDDDNVPGGGGSSSTTKKMFLKVNLSNVTEGSTVIRSTKERQIQTISLKTDNGMPIEATLEDVTPTTRSTQSLVSGTKYRVMVFQENDLTASGYVGYGDYTAGSSGLSSFQVEAGTYSFVCLSYNSISDLPTTPADGTDAVTALTVSPADYDLLYVKFNETINSSDSTINITFKHKFPTVTVIADAATKAPSDTTDGYVLNTIQALTTTFSNNYSASMAIDDDGTLSISGSAASRDITWNGIVAGKIVNSDSCTVYTGAETSFTVNLASLTVSGRVTSPAANFTFDGFGALQSGYKYRLRFYLKPLMWARGNLISDDISGSSFHFATTQEYYSGDYSTGYDYFAWNTLSPTAINSTNTTQVFDTSADGCRKIASPDASNVWRTPESYELGKLSNAPSYWTTKNGVNGRYFGISTAPSSNSDAYLFLPAGGYRGDGGTNMQNVGSEGRYWSATSYSAAYSLSMSFTSSSAGGYFLAIGCGHHIRCVTYDYN